MHVLAARRLGGTDGVLVRGVLPIRGEDGARRAVLEHGLDHIDRIVDLLDANGGTAEGIAGVSRGGVHLLNVRIGVAVEGMVEAHVAGIARATHERADRREVACDLAVQDADATRTLNKVGRGEQDVDELLNLGAQLVDGRERGELLLGQNVATHAADHVEAVGLAVTGELLGQVHGLLADAEELLEAGVEAGVVRCEANIEQV